MDHVTEGEVNKRKQHDINIIFTHMCINDTNNFVLFVIFHNVVVIIISIISRCFFFAFRLL